MAFESVRAYVQLASGLSDLTRARAMAAAQGLLSLPATSLATGTKMASQATMRGSRRAHNVAKLA